MTRDEIRLVAFIMLALIVGTIVQWWMKRNPQVAAQGEQARKSGWADPPYVFKSRAEMEQMAERVKATQRDPKNVSVDGVTAAQPTKE